MALCGFRSRELLVSSSVSLHTYVYVQVCNKKFFQVYLLRENELILCLCWPAQLYYISFLHTSNNFKKKYSFSSMVTHEWFIHHHEIVTISTLELRYTIGYWTLDKRLCQNHTLESGYDLKFIYWAKRTTLTTNQKSIIHVPLT